MMPEALGSSRSMTGSWASSGRLFWMTLTLFRTSSAAVLPSVSILKETTTTETLSIELDRMVSTLLMEATFSSISFVTDRSTSSGSAPG